jgi:protein-S-isoprenylcysteine O-methyltransferase Ste14
MPVHSYIVLAPFTLLGVVMLLLYTVFRRKGISLLGSATIDKYYFFAGKFTIFTTWAFFILKAIFPKLGYLWVPDYLSYIAIVFLWAGTILMITAFMSIGESLKVGLPSTPSNLATTGIYRYTRNPIYIGVFLISIGSCLYFPDLVNISFTLFGIYMHHRIILGEERFLSSRFGNDWQKYTACVRRYL